MGAACPTSLGEVWRRWSEQLLFGLGTGAAIASPRLWASVVAYRASGVVNAASRRAHGMRRGLSPLLWSCGAAPVTSSCPSLGPLREGGSTSSRSGPTRPPAACPVGPTRAHRASRSAALLGAGAGRIVYLLSLPGPHAPRPRLAPGSLPPLLGLLTLPALKRSAASASGRAGGPRVGPPGARASASSCTVHVLTTIPRTGSGSSGSLRRRHRRPRALTNGPTSAPAPGGVGERERRRRVLGVSPD